MDFDMPIGGETVKGRASFGAFLAYEQQFGGKDLAGDLYDGDGGYRWVAVPKAAWAMARAADPHFPDFDYFSDRMDKLTEEGMDLVPLATAISGALGSSFFRSAAAGASEEEGR